MFTRQVKRIISSVLALAFVFSIVGFFHDDVKADSNIELGQIYSVTESDYGINESLSNNSVLYTFIPEESGYYSFECTVYLSFFVLDDNQCYIWKPDCNFSGLTISAINLPQIIPNYRNRVVYELEAGTTYYVGRVFSIGGDDNTGEFCIRKITDYVAAKAVTRDINAVKNGTFTCSVDLDSTIPYESISCRWIGDYKYDDDYYSTDVPEKTFSSNDVIDFDNSTYVDSGDYEKTLKYAFSFIFIHTLHYLTPSLGLMQKTI